MRSCSPPMTPAWSNRDLKPGVAIWIGQSIPGDIGYLHCWHDYHRILKQRNHLLKSPDKAGLDVWTEKLAGAGAEVIERRQRYVALLDRQLQQHYATISGGNETAGISYQPEGVQATDRNSICTELLQLFQ